MSESESRQLKTFEPASYLIIFNIAKDVNFGFLFRTANAFGANIIVVGRNKFSRMGATACTRRSPFIRFFTLDEAIEFVRSKGCKVVGIEIGEDAKSIFDQPFNGPTAFLTGNEGSGLTPGQIAICDELVYIPQFGTAVSLNVNVAAGIVLSNFANWAGYEPAPFVGRKFNGPVGKWNKFAGGSGN